MRLPFVLLAACGPVDQLDAMTRDVHAEIETAFAADEVETDGVVNVSIGIGTLRPRQLGLTVRYVDTANIIVTEVAANVIAHELGHAMGLEHEDDVMSVMHERAASMPADRAARQLAALCKRHQCAAITLP